MATYEPRDLDDARTLRALAHPLRIELIEQLTFRGPMTATQCAALVGESPSSCSFHLRMLAKYGFVEEATGGTGRQRPWQVVTIGNRWENGPDMPPGTRAAAEALGRVVRDRDNATLDQYLARQDEFEPEWMQAAIHSNFGGWLTPAELREIGDQLLEMWRPYLERLGDRAERPEGARLVHMFAHGFPRADALDIDPPPAPARGAVRPAHSDRNTRAASDGDSHADHDAVGTPTTHERDGRDNA